jgi:truncated hemoglobin YjbI
MSRNQRHQPVVHRQADESIGEDHWLKQFEKTLQKGAVQPRSQHSLFDQINSIMNGNSNYPSVEASVIDMQERTRSV